MIHTVFTVFTHWEQCRSGTHARTISTISIGLSKAYKKTPYEVKDKRSKKLVVGNSPQLILLLMAEILHQLSVEVGSFSYIIYKV